MPSNTQINININNGSIDQNQLDIEKIKESCDLNYSKKCFFCGKKSSFVNNNGIFYCNDCYEKLFAKCEKCGNYFDKNDIYNVANKNQCYSCLIRNNYSFCFNCHTWKKNCINVENVGTYCSDCLNDHDFFRCNDCGLTYKMERYGKEGLCINCINSKLYEVKNYSYKPDPRFFKRMNVNEENLYFGIELEMGKIENANVVNDFVAEYSNSFFYMKKDTSIPAYGCEIVTQPATLSKHINSKYWKTLLETAKEYGFNSDNDKCGIHVHISRSFFNNYEIAKLDCFVNTYDIFKKIARRESHYSEYVDKEPVSWGMQTTNRKCAVNLSNTNTVELRIFKGTLEYKYVMSYIELCHALSIFVKNIDMEELMKSKESSILKFKNIINDKKYKYINKYCEEFNVF